MISFTTEGTGLVAQVSAGSDVGGGSYDFRFQFPDRLPTTVKIVAQYLNSRLGDLVREARREAYDEGYAAGRGHRSKEVWFGGCLDGC